MDKSYPKWIKVIPNGQKLCPFGHNFYPFGITFIHLGAIGRGALNVFTIETQIGAVWLINY